MNAIKRFDPIRGLGQFQFPGHGPQSVYQAVDQTVNQAAVMEGPPRMAGLTGVSFGYNEALRWLEDAEKVAAISPACNLPIIARFRQFIAGAGGPQGQLNARFDLTPSDMEGLKGFTECVKSQGTIAQVEIKDQADKEAADRKKIIVCGTAGTLTLLGLGYLAYRAW